MNTAFHDLYKNYTTAELLKITMRPDSYQPTAVIEATELLKTRVITQADVDLAEASFKKDAPAPPMFTLSENIFKVGSYNNENWLNVILAIAVFEYLHLLYTDIKFIALVFSGQNYPYRIVGMLSYIDLLYLPFVYYLFYKRKRWGWILFFGIKLFTIEPTLLFYFREYWPIAHGIGLLPYSLLTAFLDIPILIFLWKQDIIEIFKVADKTRWVTFLSIVLVVVLLTYISQHR